MSTLTCDGFIEVQTTWTMHVLFGEQTIVLPSGTKVDAPCGLTVDSREEIVQVQPHGVADWDCPRCGKTNIRTITATPTKEEGTTNGITP